MSRSQRHAVYIKGTDACGKGVAEGVAAPVYVQQFIATLPFTVPVGPAGGPLKGSTTAGFPPTALPSPKGVEGMMAESMAEGGDLTDPGQFNLSGNPSYISLPPADGTAPAPGPGPDPEPGQEPTLNSINPSSAKIGSADLLMNVNGNNFTDSSIIYFNGGAEETIFVSSSQLQTTVKPSTATTPGDYPVWVQQGSFQTVQQKSFTFTPAERTFPIGPIALAKLEDHADGIQLTLAETTDIQVGDTVNIEATGSTPMNGSYTVLSVNPGIVIDNPAELAAPIDGKGRVTVLGGA